MNRYRLLNERINKDEIIKIYKDKIVKSSKFINEINDELISVEEGFYLYCFMYGKVRDLEYYVLVDKKNIDGKIDVEIDYPSGMFLFNGLKRNNYQEVSGLDDLFIFNKEDIDKLDNEFINAFNERCIDSICQRHKVILTDKKNKIDITPIREFEILDKEFYLEKVYKIHYVTNKKNYVSVISGVSGKFYYLDFIYSDIYNDFLKKYKYPIVYIPDMLKDIYYDKSFDVYVKTLDELRYIKERELFNKIKENYLNVNHPNYYFYLLQGIFYFKKKSFLKYYQINKNDDIRYVLFDLYLTCYYQADSGYKLYEYSGVGLLEDNSLKNIIRLLEISFKLGNVYAKKILFDHYHKPKYYNEYYIKRYS